MDQGAFMRLSEALGSDASLHVVGGWVRDRWLAEAGAPRGAGDLDLATALLPKEVMQRARAKGFKVIPTGLPHGTVTVMLGDRPVEITTFRGEGEYLDGRRPVTVTLGVGLEADLARRDFTVNALALPVERMGDPDWRRFIVDPYKGREDLDRRTIKAVGDPLERFAEDGLRPLRACRFASQLAFEVEPATRAAIPERLEVCRKVAVERVFTELTKLLQGKEPARGLRMLESTGLLDLWLAELRPMVGCAQNRHHRFDVWEHTLKATELIQGGDSAFAWAMLLHDSGKPAARTVNEVGEAHFYGHETISETIADTILRRLKAPNRLRILVSGLIRLHGEHPQPDWSDAAYRRLLKRITEAGLTPEAWGQFSLADRWGKGWFDTGHPDGRSGAEWWEETREFWILAYHRLESVRFPGMTVKELALDGHALMALAGRGAGPWLGRLQAWLLEQVVEDPSINTAEGLRPLVEGWLTQWFVIGK